MPREELAAEIENGVRFWEVEADFGDLIGVMGTQNICAPTPILHALFLASFPGRGIVGRLLPQLLGIADPRAPDPGRPFCRRRVSGRIPCGSG